MDRPWIEAGLKYAAISQFDLPCLLVQRTSRIRGGSKLEAGFLRYLIGSREFTQHVLAMQTGTAVPHISASQIREFSFQRPPLDVQQRIGDVLGAFDRKIELNRRMNTTLEAMARALFQSWFVDFDPVRTVADALEQNPRDARIGPVFPPTFQDSALGQIPTGWKVGRVADLATITRNAINPSRFPSEVFDHFSLPAFDDGRTPRLELGSAIMSNKLTVDPDAVLLSKLNPHIPRVWLPDVRPSHRSIGSTEFIVARAGADVSREYLYLLFTSSFFASIYGTLVTGTTGSHQRIRPESVLDIKVIVPPVAAVTALTKMVRPMLDCVSRNSDQMRTLASLRDALMPKLLSGELRVSGIGAQL